MGLISIFDDSDFQTPQELDELLRTYPEPVDAVWIKATQGLDWVSDLAPYLAAMCIKHITPFGYYHYADGSDMSAQRGYFSSKVIKWPRAYLGNMLDYEDAGAVAKGLIGIAHFAPDITYADEDFWSHNDWGKSLSGVKWISQYFDDRSFVQSEADYYKTMGFGLWQYADYAVVGGKKWNQDVSALLFDTIAPLKAISFG